MPVKILVNSGENYDKAKALLGEVLGQGYDATNDEIETECENTNEEEIETGKCTVNYVSYLDENNALLKDLNGTYTTNLTTHDGVKVEDIEQGNVWQDPSKLKADDLDVVSKHERDE
eukprot:GFUD01007998.1.p1 GENE.GFUD01007998.1~~GFUD01007998.1.p1  ORF type:complete len:117 (+),score=32.28 GFUD01007998.1:1148-1498(+)